MYPPPDELKSLPVVGDMKWQASVLIHSQCLRGMLKATHSVESKWIDSLIIHPANTVKAFHGVNTDRADKVIVINERDTIPALRKLRNE